MLWALVITSDFRVYIHTLLMVPSYLAAGTSRSITNASCVAPELEEGNHCRRLLSVWQKRKLTAQIRTTVGHPMLRQAILSLPLLVAGAAALAQPSPLPVYLVAEFEV